MSNAMPEADNIVQDNFTTGMIRGSARNDHLIHHRDPSVEGHAGTGLVAFAGDDILEGSVPDAGQIHMFAGPGNDWMILDVTKNPDAIGHQGHHAYGGHGRNTFQFANIEENQSPIVGRLDDFNPTSDRILIEGTAIDLADLPKTVTLPSGAKIDVRVIEIEHPEFESENLGTQHFLAIGDNIFYALEGARDLQNGTSGLTGEERHFLKKDSLDTLRESETVQYVNPKNFVPIKFYEHREDELTLNWAPEGDEVFADPGENSAVHMFGGKQNHHSDSSKGSQIMHGGDGDDVIDGNTGNNTIFGGDGNNLIAGGIDNDLIHGGSGDDMIWGGDGSDTIFGGAGDNYLHGGRGDDLLVGGDGNDTLVGGPGNDTLAGGGGDDAVNRFHFFDGDGRDVITDFKAGSDLITLQDDVDPQTVRIHENDDGNTVVSYGQDNSIELRGVSLEEFQDAAELRAEEGNPIITISTDPEEELLQELLDEIGYYGDSEPPSLRIDGIKYGADPFTGSGAGGYTYVEDEPPADDEPPEDDELPEDDEPPEDGGPPEDEVPPEEDEPLEDEEDGEQSSGAGTCFVATAAYRDPWHPDVKYLRAFRDQWLAHRAWGRAFIAFYWRVGPKLAAPVRSNPWLALASKTLISGIVRVLQKVWVS
ncbi:MAG: hypothetical protein JJT95_00670 [Pararhodobacter sp.]|nr:hypothetical protein [Pararhodobacter sp.]